MTDHAEVRRDAEAKGLSEQERREAQATLDNVNTVNFNGAVYVPKSWMVRALKAEAELVQAENEVSRRDVVLDWIEANVPQAIELCPYKVKR